MVSLTKLNVFYKLAIVWTTYHICPTWDINYESRVTNTFECQFDAITTVDDINGGEAACLLDPDCQGGGGFNVTLVKETLDKEELGTFSFELVTFSNGARGFVQFTKQIQNFNLKKFI